MFCAQFVDNNNSSSSRRQKARELWKRVNKSNKMIKEFNANKCFKRFNLDKLGKRNILREISRLNFLVNFLSICYFQMYKMLFLFLYMIKYILLEK